MIEAYIEQLSSITSDLALLSITEVLLPDVALQVETLVNDAFTMIDLAKGLPGGEVITADQL